ncbi:endonuclease domain-containing protein [Aureibacter tunicatorum]|uniref:Very-short-patch-repair endonuclease n=1 Tax=Aureibacter tunicatorum TaxID=866807 RepID=A0AAE3XL48_9BACT|nr:DUF559 domain-containing protein [Aureibacter tunicatorum]MDR6239871.1 very-short-patch-repair endonuclease [Aureibacter tunicatorum]BDD04346.1 hypothetical protein AUTU_18290 [Aureibacter tunicatorum]
MKNNIIPYRKDLKHLARKFRKDSTLSEVILWQEIKNKQILGFEFHRQVPMLDYIVDFYSHELLLVIEIDGITHTYEYAKEKDAKRQKRIEEYGVRFLRFDDIDVKNHMNQVVNDIQCWIENNRDRIS